VRYGIIAFIVLAVVACVGWFAYQNTNQIPTIDLLITSASEVPLWMALFSSAIIGAGVTLLLLAWPLFRLRLNVRRQERSIGELEQEIHGLRTLPLSEEAPSERKHQET
jgi:uncharacterized integral membrane protein